jgi:hypothetical protein
MQLMPTFFKQLFARIFVPLECHETTFSSTCILLVDLNFILYFLLDRKNMNTVSNTVLKNTFLGELQNDFSFLKVYASRKLSLK